MRFGLGWRTPLGAGILANLGRIDVVEVMAEDFFDADRNAQRALRFLATHVPVVVHATSLGLASSEPVDRKSLDAVARVVGWLEPELWSEHLSFVRAAGLEIGHLAAPPRNAATLDSLRRNVEIARRVVGTAPLLENVATLIEPPLSDYDEAEWMTVVAETNELLLDLHNLHANATNFGFDARDVLSRIPHDRVRAIHLAGGRVIERQRVLDDHLHDVPDPVYELLAYAGNHETMVILERDGRYPPIDVLLGELDRARAVVQRPSPPAPLPVERGEGGPEQSEGPGEGSTAADRFLTVLYLDQEARARFLADPLTESRAHGFDEVTAHRLASMNTADLQLAANSFAKKRAAKSAASHQPAR